ncbi:UNVERIFIED_CONTAM: hypothetical protein GTU68_010569 [Idotea baltica]|nr:hypothetical protein [Idotea baltica]
MRDMFRKCATERLFLHEVLKPFYEAIVYMDTDTVFMKPPEMLFSVFEDFTEDEMIGVTPELYYYNTIASNVRKTILFRNDSYFPFKFIIIHCKFFLNMLQVKVYFNTFSNMKFVKR